MWRRDGVGAIVPWWETICQWPFTLPQDDETVVFAWIVWPSRQVRDEGMKKVMADPRVQPEVNPMPFDGQP